MNRSTVTFRRSTVVAAALVLLLLTSGCGRTSTTTVDQAAPSSSIAPSATPSSGVRASVGADSFSPLADLAGAGGDTAIGYYNNATQAVIGPCMQASGFSYEIPPKYTPPGPPTTTPDGALAFAKQSGFGLLHVGAGPHAAVATDERAALDRQGSYIASLSSDKQAAYSSAMQACKTTADQTVGKFFPMFQPEIAAAINKERSQVDNDPRMVTAVKNWSQCMAKEGIAAQDEAQAKKPFSDAITNKTFSAELYADEITVATASASCSKDTVWPAERTIELEAVTRLEQRFGGERLCGRLCVPGA